MNYKIHPTKEFSKDFKKIESFSQKRIKNKIEEVAEIVFGHKYRKK